MDGDEKVTTAGIYGDRWDYGGSVLRWEEVCVSKLVVLFWRSGVLIGEWS